MVQASRNTGCYIRRGLLLIVYVDLLFHFPKGATSWQNLIRSSRDQTFKIVAQGTKPSKDYNDASSSSIPSSPCKPRPNVRVSIPKACAPRDPRQNVRVVSANYVRFIAVSSPTVCSLPRDPRQNVRVSIPKVCSDEIARVLLDGSGGHVPLLQQPLQLYRPGSPGHHPNHLIRKGFRLF